MTGRKCVRVCGHFVYFVTMSGNFCIVASFVKKTCCFLFICNYGMLITYLSHFLFKNMVYCMLGRILCLICC